MKSMISPTFAIACLLTFGTCLSAPAQPAVGNRPYGVVRSAKVGGAGGYDYLFADAAGRRLYIPRSNRVTVFDLDTLQSAGEISGTNEVHGVAIDSRSQHGFSSSQPVVMWDTRTLATIRTLPVGGRPDGILFDPAVQRVFVFSHRAPNVTVFDGRDGKFVGTIELDGAPEQAVSDARGHVYVDIEDRDNVAVVDALRLKVIAHYALGGHGKTPAGLALDAANRRLFVSCRNPAVCVVLNANNGQCLATLPIGVGTDGALFNPHTLEAFTSQRDGTLTVIKELSPVRFAVEQNVPTRTGARTSTLDAKTNRIFLVAAEWAPPVQPGAIPPPPTGAKSRNAARGQLVPGSFTILMVGQ